MHQYYTWQLDRLLSDYLPLHILDLSLGNTLFTRFVELWVLFVYTVRHSTIGVVLERFEFGSLEPVSHDCICVGGSIKLQFSSRAHNIYISVHFLIYPYMYEESEALQGWGSSRAVFETGFQIGWVVNSELHTKF